MKKTIITILVLVVVAIIGVYLFNKKAPAEPVSNLPDVSVPTGSMSTSTGSTQSQTPGQTTLGTSVGGNPIIAYTYGTGSRELLIVGGIHGGYEWNTVLAAQELNNYFKADPSAVPSNMKVTIIPVLNPDGLAKVVSTTSGNFKASQVSTSQTVLTSGRFNGNKVDLNRNFDCDWQAQGTWQNTPVSGGTSAFSEPESAAIQSYVQANNPAAVLVFYSAAGGVYASSCHNGISPDTDALTKAYAKASGYTGHTTFDAYPTTGDMTNWLAKINVPAISVLLTDHTNTEWAKNLPGVQSMLTYISSK